VYLLPGMVAAAKSVRGPSRLIWYCVAAASLAVFILTISRGGYVALVIGYTWAIFICRRYLPLSRVGAWVLTGVTASLIVVAVVSVAVPHVGDVVTGRFLGQSTAIDMSEVSSGRTNIWKNTIEHMMAEPVTLVTGFGWNVYNTRFIFVTHNYYLDQWFNLGLIGLGALLVILYQAVATARRAADAADPETRSYLIAFIFGILGLAVCIFFTNLTRPWPYVWMYMALTLRAAANVLAEAEHKEAQKPLRASPSHVIAHSHAQAVRNSR
jgi:O-antigen ligase